MTLLARLIALVAVVTAVGCSDDEECIYYDRAGADFAPEEFRDPQTGTCQSFGGGCNSSCEPCPAEGDIAQAQPDWGSCYSQCEALDESACRVTSGCRAVYSGTFNSANFYQCWAVAQSGPIQGGNCNGLDAYACSRHDDCVAVHEIGAPIGGFASCQPEQGMQDPGSCVGEVTCDALPPNCPSGTIPGRRNGCWTGYCIPQADCDQLPACTTLGEMDCIGRTDCEPTYEGHNCSCSPSGCTCQSWTFDSCRAMP